MKAKKSDNLILEKLLSKDDLGLAILYEAYADTLLHYFRIKFSTVDEDVLQSCICDSLIAFSQHPERYQPQKSALKSYLIMDIHQNILNDLDKEKRLKRRNPTVELLPEHENNKDEGEVFLLNNVDTEFMRQQVAEYFNLIFDDPLNEKLAWMIEIERVRETSAYVHLLEIQHLSVAEQKDEVKRHKDRIGVQLRRKGWSEFTKKLKQDATR